VVSDLKLLPGLHAVPPRTETLRAFTEEEYRRIVSDLPKPDTK
jgi:hypothetical protein